MLNNVNRTAKLVLVDLAGSERLAVTTAPGQPALDPAQIEEAKHINKSLSAIGYVP